MNLQFARYTLANGMAVIVKENHHAQSVVIRGYVPGGSNLDPAAKAGLASFGASAMRRGNARRTYTEINEATESVAASVYVNAGRHMLGFGGKSLAEDFNLLVEIMADNLLVPIFPENEIEKLRGQIITDLQELEDDPRGLARRNFRRLLYGLEHPYGRSADGEPDTVPAISRHDILDYFRHLHPRHGAIVVVGDIAADNVFRILETAVGQWQPPHPPPDTSLPPVLPLAAAITHIQPMPNKSQVDLVLGSLGPERLAADFYPAYVGDTILGQLGLGGRIGQIVRDEQGMAYYARSSLQSGFGPAPWIVYAGVNPTAVDQAITLIRQEIRRFREEPVSAAELADAQSFLTGVMPLQMETNEGVAAVLTEMHMYELGDDFISRYPDIINAITPADIQAAAQKHLNEDTYALAVAGPYSQQTM